MNGVWVLASQPWIGRLGWTLLHFLWQGTAIAFFYTIARFLFARCLSPRARYGFACAALVAMAAAPPLTWLTISNRTIEPAQIATWAQPLAEWRWLTPAIVACWVAGMLGFSVRLLSAFRFTRRLRAASYAAPAIWQKALDGIAAQMGGAQVRLMGSSMVSVPGVIGYLRPIIIVPVTFLTGTPAEHVVALLTHEMAHIRRNDYIACILQSIAEVVLFYHPAVWWISGQIRAERELCCDDMAIACGTDALTYAHALTEMARRAVRLNTQLAANGGSLADRIRRLIEPAYTGGHYLPGTGSALAMLLLWMVGAALAAVPGTQTPLAPTAASLADTFVSPGPVRTQVPASGVPDLPLTRSLLDQAQKTLLFDPVFSAQLAQAQPTGIGGDQGRAAAKPATPPTGFVVETVTARNAGSGIIEGLTKEDFAVTENDTRQEVSFFDFEHVDRLAAEAPLLAQAAAARPLSRLPRAEFAAEKAQLRYKDHRLVVLYFDMASMQAADQLRALEGAQKFIGTQMSSVDKLCLMRNTGAGAELLQDFTADRDRLLSVIATLAAGATGPADSGLTTSGAESQLAALRTAAKMLGGLKEKKVLVYFSGGLNLVGTDNQAMLRAAIVDAVRAGVSVWPRGGAPGQEAINSLASETGKAVAADSPDIASGIAAAERSIASYYIVGYSTTDNVQDGTYRRVKVTLPGNTEAKLDYPQGYFAGKNFGPPPADADGRERQLQDAMVMGEPLTDLTVAGEVNYFRQNNAEYFAPITLKIPGSELVAAKNSGAQLASLEFVGQVKDSLGTNEAVFRDVVEVRLANSTAAELAMRPVTYNASVVLLPGAYSIKVLVRDNTTGRMGEYLGKFTVANLNRDAQLPITSVVLSSQLIDDAAAFTGEVKPRPTQPLVNPLVQDGKKMIPSVTRVFSSKSDMYVYLQAFERGATTAAPLMARVAFYQGPVKVMETSGVKASDGLDPKTRMLPIRMEVALGSLKPGDYDCQVTVVDPATQKSAIWQRPVTIVP